MPVASFAGLPTATQVAIVVGIVVVVCMWIYSMNRYEK